MSSSLISLIQSQATMDTEDRWYVLRDLARPNAKNPAYKQLQEMPELEGCVFIPMKQRMFVEFGKHVVRLIPYMHDLVFVHKPKEALDPIIKKMDLLQYRYVRGGKQYEAMSVRHKDFEKFKEAVEQSDNVTQHIRQTDTHHRRPPRWLRGSPHEQEGKQIQAPPHRPP